MNNSIATDFFRDIATSMEPILKKRIADELYPRMDEIVKEEISKIALTLVKGVSFDGNRITIVIEDRRNRP